MKSHAGSELSKILSGIRDDQEQDQYYKQTAQVESGLFHSLTKNEDNLSRRASISANHSMRDSEEIVGYRKEDKGDRRVNVAVGVDNEEDTDHDGEGERESADEDCGPPMDTGFAWVIAICLMVAVFSTWGAAASFGVYLNYYISSNSFPGGTEYDYALIGGMINCFAQLCAPVCVLAYKMFGPARTISFGILFQTIGYILASFSTKIWQLYLTQGLLVGVLFLFIFLPATLMLPTWFNKRKATAMGITVAGSGLGGLFFSLVSQKLINQTGDQKWALRMTAIVSGVVAGIACAIMKPRNYKPLPLSETLTKDFIFLNSKAIFSFSVFKDYGLIILGAWFGLALLGYILVLYTLSAYGTLVGLTASQGSVITAVLNASQVVGRPTCGAIADRIGRFNWTIIHCLVIAIFIWAFWLNATTYGTLLGFAVVIGFTVGVGSLFAQPLASDIVSDQSKLPSAWSGLNIIVSFFCLFSEVMALGIRNKKSKNPYQNTQIFGGACYFICAILLCIIRENIVRRNLNDRLALAREQLMTKSGYLKECKDEDKELIESRIERYELLVQQKSVKFFFFRMFYPIKV